MRRRDDPVAHLLPAFSPAETVWLVRNRAAAARALADAGVAVYSRRRVLGGRALEVTPEWIREARAALRAGHVLCRECARGDACPAWAGVAWDGYAPRSPDATVRPDAAALADLLDEVLGFRRVPEETPTAAACATLGLAWPCSPQDLVAAYRALARAHHPDLGGDAARFVQINTARDVVRRALEGASP